VSADWVSLVDIDRLAAWMSERGVGSGPIEDVAPLGGGTQNVLLQFSYGGRRLVLRRPPPKPRPESNETMRREARLLAALASTKVPHPTVVASCSEEAPLGAAFYVMEAIDGFNALTGIPAPHASDPLLRHRMGMALVDGIAALGQVDYQAVGLKDFGKPENFIGRQVARWRKQLDDYRQYSNWPGAADLPGIDAIAAFLERNQDVEYRPGLIHGDYHIGNVLFRWDSPEIGAIIDWELATVGDPLLDLGWLLSTWPGSDGFLEPICFEPVDGFPSAEELIARYASQTDRDMSSINWFIILACFKFAVIVEGTFARSCAGLDPKETGLRLHATARKLLRRATALLN
jgi:aminoglycoside phosphotransferase (APT) family kinase protein